MPRGPAGSPQVVPLGQVAAVREGSGPRRSTTSTASASSTSRANVAGRSLSEVVQDIERRLAAEVKLPPGYTLTQGGESEDQAEVFGASSSRSRLAVLLMYLILVMQFGSFLDPLAILISLPLSLIGVVLALLVTGDTLNIMSLIGVILLMGIVAKNAILLIDFAKWAREERGISIRDALIEAGRNPAPAHHDDERRDHRRHDPGRARPGRGRRLPRAARPGGDRRRHHPHSHSSSSPLSPRSWEGTTGA